MNLSDNTFLMGYVTLILFIMGTIFGSAINCLAGRIVEGTSWLKGKSHCEYCGHELGFWDLVPLLSYIFLRGRCRYCHKKVSIRYFLTELLLGLLFVGVFLSRKMLDYQLFRDLVLICILFGLSLVDLDSYIIPDGFIIAGIVNWIVSILFVSDKKTYITQGSLGGLAIAGSVLLLSLLMDKILKKESMGGGDIKLLFMVCLYLGPLKGLLCLFLSCVIGLIFVILLKERKIAFGPSISIGTYLVLLYGQSLLEWYLKLL